MARHFELLPLPWTLTWGGADTYTGHHIVFNETWTCLDTHSELFGKAKRHQHPTKNGQTETTPDLSNTNRQRHTEGSRNKSSAKRVTTRGHVDYKCD